MKYLILGSAGQIGEPLCEFLINKNENILEYDMEKDPNQDLRIKNSILENCIKESDFIFFLAFDVGGSRYLSKYQNTFDFIHNNILLMSNVFDLIKKYKKPFIFTSSQMSNMDYSSYGILKSIGEKYTTSLDGLTVKFWNVYGPEKRLDKSHVITDFIIQAKNNNSINMMTDGTESRQFLHVDDCAEALYALSKQFNNLQKNREYHITSFKWHTIYNVAKIISSYHNNVPINRKNSQDLVQNNKKNEPDEYILNFWQPKISLEEGIRKVMEKMYAN